MKNLLTFFAAALFFCVSPLFAQESSFDVVLSGKLASKLEPSTFVTFSTIGTTKDYPYVSMETTIENFPFKLPSQYFQNRTVFVRFRSPSLNRSIFSMRLSSDLFDEPRRINIKLDEPKPRLRPHPISGDIRYTANITKRMAYIDMPHWDAKLERLTPLPEPLAMRLATIGGEELESVELGERCMGARWYAQFEKDTEFPDNTALQYSVLYDSGGLFDPIETKLELMSSWELKDWDLEHD